MLIISKCHKNKSRNVGNEFSVSKQTITRIDWEIKTHGDISPLIVILGSVQTLRNAKFPTF